MTVHYLPTPSVEVVFMVDAIKRSAAIRTTHPVQLQFEAEEWVRYGFTPEEAVHWLREGYEGLAYLAAKLRKLGLSARQGGCALTDLEYLLRPNYGWDEEERFLRRARHYKDCCMGRP